MNGEKIAVIYVRVSTMRQAVEGISIEAQISRARAWAEGMDYEVAGEFTDAGISGKRIDNRPSLQEAIEKTCKKKAALVVYSLSRLGRSTKDVITIAERLDKAGADLVSLSENIDTTSAAGKMVFRMLAVLSEFERDLISERTAAALSYKRANGFKTGGAHAPFGYDVDRDGKLVANDDEQKVIKLILKLREKGHSLRAIGEELKKRGIETKDGGKMESKNGKGGRGPGKLKVISVTSPPKGNKDIADEPEIRELKELVRQGKVDPDRVQEYIDVEAEKDGEKEKSEQSEKEQGGNKEPGEGRDNEK